MSKATIETHSGIWFDILEPTPDMINIEDVAHALSQTNRFTGHCRFPYPVSQHCRLASYIVAPLFAFHTLLHDASEAYIGDMSRPLKHFTLAGEEYRKVEKRIEEAIAIKFKLSAEEPIEVKQADTAMLFLEKEQLMTAVPWDMNKEEAMSRMDNGGWLSVENHDIKITEIDFWTNKKMFLDRFYELTDQI
jgi:5'-deoxynucleotidase YfbR-like HD superfamily hydrolase